MGFNELTIPGDNSLIIIHNSDICIKIPGDHLLIHSLTSHMTQITMEMRVSYLVKTFKMLQELMNKQLQQIIH